MKGGLWAENRRWSMRIPVPVSAIWRSRLPHHYRGVQLRPCLSRSYTCTRYGHQFGEFVTRRGLQPDLRDCAMKFCRGCSLPGRSRTVTSEWTPPVRARTPRLPQRAERCGAAPSEVNRTSEGDSTTHSKNVGNYAFDADVEVECGCTRSEYFSHGLHVSGREHDIEANA
jgi:hypothetical protein